MPSSLASLSRVLGVLALALLPCFGQGAKSQPPAHSLIPGLVIQPLPISLSNINSLEYGPSGKLYAVGYDARVHVLQDTDGDGDGMEDRATLF